MANLPVLKTESSETPKLLLVTADTPPRKPQPYDAAMHINPGGNSPPVIDKPAADSLPRISAAERVPSELPGRQTSEAQAATERLLAQVVAQRKDGLIQLRTVSGNSLVNLQSQIQVKPGQLILLEKSLSNGRTKLSLQTQLRPLTEQILRLLVPNGGDLRAKFSLAAQLPHLPNSLPTTQTVLPNTSQNGLFSFLKQPVGTSQTNSPSASIASQNLASGPLSGQASGSLNGPPGTSNTQIGNSLLQKLQTFIAPNQNPPAKESAPLLKEPSGLLQSLMSTSQLRQPAQIAPLLQPGQTPALLKLVMPLLQTNLARVPLNSDQQQQRDAQTTALTQLAARILLGAMRAPNSGNEVEVSRGEWLTRFEQNLDSLQVELNVVRDPVKEREGGDAKTEEEPSGKVRQWRVRLAFEFDELGLITAFVLLSADKKMEVQFWSELDATRVKLEQYTLKFNDQLDQAVTQYGVEQLEIGVFEGTPPPSRQSISSQLIDETA